MVKEDLPTHMKRLAVFFRERRFGEAMEYLDSLPPEVRGCLGRELGTQFPECAGEIRAEPLARE